MTERFTKIVTDCSTGDSLEVELTQEEIDEVLKTRAQAEEVLAQLDLEKAAQEQKRQDALAKLAELGLTEEEVKAIIS